MRKNSYEGKHQAKTARGGRMTALTVALALILTVAIGGTIAWLVTKSNSITNTFQPSQVTCEVKEDFNKDTGVKENITVQNTGDIDAFIRVKLVTYRTNDQGQHIGGTATLPNFTLGENWVEYGGYYYYTKPVAPGDTPAANLADSMTLTEAYNDADGGHQAIDVMAEAIQSVPEAAVKAAWGTNFSIDDNGNLVVPQN